MNRFYDSAVLKNTMNISWCLRLNIETSGFGFSTALQFQMPTKSFSNKLLIPLNIGRVIGKYLLSKIFAFAIFKK